MNKFELGHIVATSGVNRELYHEAFHDFVLECLFTRYSNCDWGEMPADDIEANDYALKRGGRLFASYKLPDNVYVEGEDKIWIITEWDRSATTILFPSEY